MRILLPLFLILVSVGLFIGYINPTYQHAKTLKAQEQQYNAALTQSSQVRQVRDQLLARRNTFATDEVRKLERLLPDNVDNIRLIMDINDIAKRYGLQIGDVSFSATQGERQNVLGSGSAVIGSVEVSFSVLATYANLVAFMGDLESSLRLVDIDSIRFNATVASVGADVPNKYSLQARTYWLR